MKALILAGGKGTRLRPFTTVVPKPLMPVGQYPILEIILRQLKSNGVTEVILAVGYLHHLLEAFFKNGSDYGLKITYSKEAEPLGTAGPVANVLDQLGEDFIVMNGDLLTTADYSDIFKFHQKQKAAATIAVCEREVKIDFGVIEFDEKKRLEHYIEKPVYQYHVSMGINVLNANAVRPYLKKGVYLDLPDLMTKLQKDGLPVICYDKPCEWLDIGRLDDYQSATEIFESRQRDFFRKAG